MIKLFNYKNYNVEISEEAYLLKPFRRIIDRDKTKNKETAKLELAYIYFYCDPRSDYQYLVDSDDRHEAIVKGEGMPDKWKPDAELKKAMEFYESFKPTSALLLEDTRYAVDKLRKLLREIDLGQTDNNGKPIYTLNTITATIKQVPALIKELNEAEKTLKDDIRESVKVKGNKEISIFEDGVEWS